ncbi:hypothetical protein B0T21DRAFT_106728 [Apiosordaria backusii]|uniref:Uncharacterized protein n=1 Tax=Apiosordaria backusii TaxID=314023 RepID=A0AA39ZV28_9PEZI|nr:hypothetical protein B0T21DRAFT_106728 [Apiosordaria backusii]
MDNIIVKHEGRNYLDDDEALEEQLVEVRKQRLNRTLDQRIQHVIPKYKPYRDQLAKGDQRREMNAGVRESIRKERRRLEEEKRRVEEEKRRAEEEMVRIQNWESKVEEDERRLEDDDAQSTRLREVAQREIDLLNERFYNEMVEIATGFGRGGGRAIVDPLNLGLPSRDRLSQRIKYLVDMRYDTSGNTLQNPLDMTADEVGHRGTPPTPEQQARPQLLPTRVWACFEARKNKDHHVTTFLFSRASCFLAHSALPHCEFL